MSNQRPANMHRAAMPNDGMISLKALIDFMEKCEIALEKNENTDAAFYFGQVKEFIQQNPHKGLSESCEKILGI